MPLTMYRRKGILYIRHNNKVQTITQWSKELKINRDTLRSRILVLQWPLELALKLKRGAYGKNIGKRRRKYRAKKVKRPKLPKDFTFV